MRVAYLINQYPKISHTFIRREILALERHGCEVIRLALRGWRDNIVDAVDLAEQKRTRYVLREGALSLLAAIGRVLFTRPGSFFRGLALAWRMGRRSDRPLFVHLIYLAEACLIEAWVREAGVAHLHAHFGTNSAEIAMLAHTLGGPDFSFTVHGPEEFDKAESLGLREKIRRCSFVVGISSYTRSQLYRWARYEDWPKVHVVRCGLEAVYSEHAAEVPATRRLVCVGRLCAQKGQLLLLQAAQRLVASGVEFELVLAGDGEMRDTLRAFIERHKLQDRVTITGWISGERVRTEILAARALVLPSFAEGLPVVIMEAMALGRPVISTFVAGIPELIQTGESGWLVPAGDEEALMRAMQACLETPTDILNAMRRVARKHVASRHDIDVETERLVGLFSL
jgi:glycosyltransferase involved in cell wall biosynthesis